MRPRPIEDPAAEHFERLADEERASLGLYRKAYLRVWKSGPHHRTSAMLDTPRKRLALRALRGHWERFPVSPARYEGTLRRVVAAEWPSQQTPPLGR